MARWHTEVMPAATRPDGDRPPKAAVHVANVLAHEQAGAAAPDCGETQEPMDMAYLEALDVSEQLPQWRAMATNGWLARGLCSCR